MKGNYVGFGVLGAAVLLLTYCNNRGLSRIEERLIGIGNDGPVHESTNTEVGPVRTGLSEGSPYGERIANTLDRMYTRMSEDLGEIKSSLRKLDRNAEEYVSDLEEIRLHLGDLKRHWGIRGVVEDLNEARAKEILERWKKEDKGE